MFEDGSGFGFFFGVTFLAPLLTIGLVVLGIVAISRNDPDPSGRRPFAFYLYSVCFVTLFAIIISGVGVVSSVADLVGDDDEVSFSSGSDDSDSDSGSDDSESSSGIIGFDDDGNPIRRGSSGSSSQSSSDDGEETDEVVRNSVQAGMVMLIALGIFAFHWRQAEEISREPEFWGSPASRVRSTYLYLVCFVAMTILLVAGAIAAYSLFRVLLPEIAAGVGQTDDAEREAGARQFLSSGALVAVAFVLVSTHTRWLKALRPVPRTAEVSFQRPPDPPDPVFKKRPDPPDASFQKPPDPEV